VDAHKGSEIRVIRAINDHRAARNRKVARRRRRRRHSSLFFWSRNRSQQINQQIKSIRAAAGDTRSGRRLEIDLIQSGPAGNPGQQGIEQQWPDEKSDDRAGVASRRSGDEQPSRRSGDEKNRATSSSIRTRRIGRYLGARSGRSLQDPDRVFEAIREAIRADHEEQDRLAHGVSGDEARGRAIPGRDRTDSTKMTGKKTTAASTGTG
jgi:hypothetical protein